MASGNEVDQTAKRVEWIDGNAERNRSSRSAAAGGGVQTAAAGGGGSTRETQKIVDKIAGEVLQSCLAACKAAGLDAPATGGVLGAMVRMHNASSPTAATAPPPPNTANNSTLPDAPQAPSAAKSQAGAGSDQARPTKVDVDIGMRYRACLMGLAIGDGVAVACVSVGASSLAQLNTLLAGPHAPLHEQAKKSSALQLDGACAIQIGAWSHSTASCLATAEGLVACNSAAHPPDRGTSDMRMRQTSDMMMRLLRMWRTGRGACSPGHSSGIDAASVEALTMFEGSSNKVAAIRGCTSIAGAGPGALARVPAVVLFECPRTEMPSSQIPSASQAVAAAAENTRATHDVLASTDTSRLMAAILCAILTSPSDAMTTKAWVLRKRHDSPIYSDLCTSRPFERQVREVADGSFMTNSCPQNRQQAAPEVLAQALWALYHASSFVDGLDRLLVHRVSGHVLSTYGSLAGALFGENQLPLEWRLLMHKSQVIQKLAHDLDTLASVRAQSKIGTGA